jgi:multidrug resistance efflux pump
MRRIIRRHWWWLPLAAVIAFFALNITRTVRAPSPALARASDGDRARRTEIPTSGEDRRWPRRAADGLVVGNGAVEPRGEVIRVAGSAPGLIAAVLVQEGDRVEAGQVLARLDDGAERAGVAAAEAQLEATRAALSKVRRGSRVEERAAARAAAASAAARAALSRGVHQRTLAVHRSARGAVAVDQLERTRARAQADREAARQAAAQRDRVLNGARREDRRAARARLKSALARLELARVMLARRQIAAPAAGEVLRVNHRAGEYYVPGEGGPIVELGDTRSLRVRMEVDERDLGRVVTGAAASVEAPAYPGRRFEARVVQLGRSMGRKQVVTGDPGERRDVQVLEVLLRLEEGAPLVVGQRVVAYVTPAAGLKSGD